MSTDKFVIRVVVITVAGLSAVALIGMVALALRHDLDPQVLKEAFLLVAGALVGLLARTSSSSDDPQPVTVTNSDTEPVPVDPAPPGPLQLPKL